MKKLKLFCAIVTALLAVSLTGCKPNADEEDFTKDSIGEWMIGEWDFVTEATMKMSIPSMPEYGSDETIKDSGTIEITGIEDNSLVTLTYTEEDYTESITFKEFIDEYLTSALPEEEAEELVAMGGKVSQSCKVNSEKNKITMKASASVSQEGMEMSMSGTFVMTKK